MSKVGETYGFDAIRGIQAGREFYVAMCPLKIIPKLFVFTEFDLPPELRAQRTLRASRIPAIKNYILNNLQGDLSSYWDGHFCQGALIDSKWRGFRKLENNSLDINGNNV